MKNIKKYIEDVAIIIGLMLIITATFLWSLIAGIYIIGLIFVLAGIFFARVLQ